MSSKNFVFTSAGDNTNFDDLWVSNNQNYDIYVIYYGNDESNFEKYKEKVKFIEKRKGSKFQNFYYFYKNYPEIIKEYDYFFILDDDIIFNTNDINNMFYYAKKYDLLICQPSFTIQSAISHFITLNNPHIFLSYTNFIEVNTPLFKKEALIKFIDNYDPILIGWGIDFLYIQCNGKGLKKSYAIIHKIVCCNPKSENKKNKTRELYLIDNAREREKTWNIFANKNDWISFYNPYAYSFLINDIIKDEKIELDNDNKEKN